MKKSSRKRKKQNKIRHYLALAKKNPHQAFFDLLNLVLAIFALGIIFMIIIWIIEVFHGEKRVSPVAFSLGSWNIYWYGITFALAFLAGLAVLLKEARRAKLHSDLIINFVFGGTICGFLGARLVFAFLNWDYYYHHPLQTLNIWQGGLSLHGALLGGLIFIIVYSLIKKVNYWQILDIFAPAMLLGQVIGRWGNFFNQELFGYPTKWWLKMYISPFNRPYEYRSFAYFHPVFLYESFLCLVALIILLIIRRRKFIKTGEVFLWYLISYSTIRFFIEFIRIEPKIFLGLTLAQIVSIIIFAGAGVVMRVRRKLGIGK